LRAYRHGLYIVGTEKLMALISRSSVSPVLAQIEDLRADTDPIEIATQFLGYIGLATSRQTDHRNHMRLIHEICTFTYKKEENMKKRIS